MNSRTPATRPVTSDTLLASAAKHRETPALTGPGFMELRAQECEALAAKIETFELALDAQCAWCTDREKVVMRAASGIELEASDWGMNVEVS